MEPLPTGAGDEMLKKIKTRESIGKALEKHGESMGKAWGTHWESKGIMGEKAFFLAEKMEDLGPGVLEVFSGKPVPEQTW